MSEITWIDEALSSARPHVVAGLLRYFRDLDRAEEAFQEASLRALKHWPKNGPPRDPASWLLFVGKNAALDGLRRRKWEVALPDDESVVSDTSDRESAEVDRIDRERYGDDILRLLFVCCHPELPATQQLALALRVVCGIPVKQIARAFLVGEAAMEQRITRAKATISTAGIPFETPSAAARAERLAEVTTIVYLLFNEGYSAASRTAPARSPLCEEAIRLGRLLLSVFPREPSLMGLLALMLLQHSRASARFADDGTVILLEDQDRARWDARAIAEGLALVEKGLRHAPDPYVVQAAIAAVHARATRPRDTDWSAIERLYALLEEIAPSPVVTLNRAVAVSKVEGAEAALALIAPLAPRLDGYFHYHGLRGGLLEQLGRSSEARHAFNRAIGLATTPAEATHIRMHLDKLADR